MRQEIISESLLSKQIDRLAEIYPKREAQNIVEALLLDSHGFSKSDLILQKEVVLDKKLLDHQIRRLLAHEPVQYITGISHFFGKKFKISRDVLIPRPETEELVDWVLKDQTNISPIICDIGTGSGCIAISLASVISDAKVIGLDISNQALKIARENSKALQVPVSFFQCDILKGFPEDFRTDIIVSNPPYIPKLDGLKMNRNVTDFEPEISLFVPDDNPLIFYQMIAEESIECLNPNGKIFFEIHEKFGDQVKELLLKVGYATVEIRKDLQGKNRLIKAMID